MTKINAFSCLLILLCLFPGFKLRGQILDDFSDGNLTTNPVWVGDTSNFLVNPAGELQLNAPDAGNSMLAVSGTMPDSAVWLLSVRMEFAPSASNLLRIYLMADQADLTKANGYYLEIGENGTADAIRLFRQDAGSGILLATGVPGFVANEPVDIRIRSRRSSTGAWTVEAASGNNAYQLQYALSDAAYSPGPARFFGLYCLYTATRKDKFYFDDLSVLPDLPDTQAPVLLSAKAVSGTELLAQFDEYLDAVTALDPVRYSVSGVGQPASVMFNGMDRQGVLLSLPVPLSTGQYTLTTEQIADTVGNLSGVQSAPFSFIQIEQAAEFDILINEIMADPTPTAGLPEVEWLELYNRSDKIIDLKNLRLSDGGTPQALPAYLLYPGALLVLSTTAGASALAPLAIPVVGMPGFPSLNNDGDPLTLTDVSGQFIDQVVYSSSWHLDSDKRAGGWSLERINPGLPCLGGENWQSCPVLPGGTPGVENASFETIPDTEAPSLQAAFPEDANTLRLRFSEGLDKSTATNPAVYHLAPPRTIAGAALAPDTRREVLLTLAEPLEPGVVYALSISGGLRDCSGNGALTSDTALVGLPETPEWQDIVVNEVLFNPATGGADFVELYNQSDKIFSWEHFFLANFSNGADIEPIALNRLFLPGEFVVFTPDPADIEARFAGVQTEQLIGLPLPSLPDEEGNISIYWSKDGTVITIDSFDYKASYHNALLRTSERDGVSLERIRPSGPTNEASNWTSAARTAFGWGTPTLPNSQQLNGGIPAGGDFVLLDPPRLSPDGDGTEDYLNIRYTLPATGFAATMTIYDSEGIPVKRLVRQELLGTEGDLRWDGDMEDGTLARPGIYILYMQIFSPEGDVRQVKKPFALVKRF